MSKSAVCDCKIRDYSAYSDEKKQQIAPLLGAICLLLGETCMSVRNENYENLLSGVFSEYGPEFLSGLKQFVKCLAVGLRVIL